MTTKRALITGARGQDGKYLVRLLLEKGYDVHGLVRKDASPADEIEEEVTWHLGDLADAGSLGTAVLKARPHEIYNLAAQSHIPTSFNAPEFTANTSGLGTLRLLEALRTGDLLNLTRFYQASSSEIFGAAVDSPQTEHTPFFPQSPYAIAKVFAYWSVVNYRQVHSLFACNGILYNHESPYRPSSFVVRKVTQGLCRIKLGKQKQLVLGNLDVCRDWGHARDYVQAMWTMLQQDTPDDYIVATGVARSVRTLVETAAAALDIDLRWDGQGIHEKGINAANGQTIISISRDFYRPTENFNLVGDASKIKRVTGWTPATSFEEMVGELVETDLRNLSTS